MSRKAKNLTEAYAFVLPSLLLTLVLSVYPIVWAMRYMFYNYQGYGEAVFIGLDNFARLFRDQEFMNSIKNTSIFAVGKLLLSLPISLLLAVILNKGLKGRHFLRAVYFLPTVISSAVIAVVFYILLNSYNGIINQYLIKLGILDTGINWLGPDWAMLSVILVAVWGAVGNYMLLFLAGLQSIPEDLYESASIDGANGFRKFWHITVPMLGPVLQMIVMLAILAALKGYESIMVLTAGGPIGKTEVMFLYVYRLFFPIDAGSSFVQEIGYGSAVGFASAVIVGVITVAYFALSRRLNRIY